MSNSEQCTEYGRSVKYNDQLPTGDWTGAEWMEWHIEQIDGYQGQAKLYKDEYYAIKSQKYSEADEAYVKRLIRENKCLLVDNVELSKKLDKEKLQHDQEKLEHAQTRMQLQTARRNLTALQHGFRAYKKALCELEQIAEEDDSELEQKEDDSEPEQIKSHK